MVNTRNKSALKAEFAKQRIEGKIKGLTATLFKLASHPEKPDHRGPLFISLNSMFKPAASYDGMLGSLIIEGLLGTAFSEAANDNDVAAAVSAAGKANLDTLSDAVSEYLESKEKERYGENKGKGSYALGQHKSICNKFNDNENTEAMAAYLRDLKTRLQIEGTIANMSCEYYAMTA